MNSYTITPGDGRSAQELIKSTQCDVGSYAQSFLGSVDFPLTSTEKKEDVQIVLVQFSSDPSTTEVLEEFKKQGLLQPRAEDTLLFAEKYPEEQGNNPIVFLHEPWMTPGGGKSVFILRQYGSVRYLHMALAEPQNKWYAHHRFAGVKKS
ncbi:MAG: hypothetical protein V4481_00625 [Patescibacteria group bacterium]